MIEFVYIESNRSAVLAVAQAAVATGAFSAFNFAGLSCQLRIVIRTTGISGIMPDQTKIKQSEAEPQNTMNAGKS